MRESARIYDVRMAQFVLKIEKLSHIIGARGSQDLRSPSPIMAPGNNNDNDNDNDNDNNKIFMQDDHYIYPVINHGLGR